MFDRSTLIMAIVAIIFAALSVLCIKQLSETSYEHKMLTSVSYEISDGELTDILKQDADIDALSRSKFYNVLYVILLLICSMITGACSIYVFIDITDF